jgi:hypothetical protein
MATVFWDRNEVLMVKFMQQGSTITSQVYGETLKKLCRAIQKKTHGTLTYGVVLLHDNAATFAGRGCCMFSATNSMAINLGFLD